mmetsp:Transcript_35179/g.80534  ORF Transcript_35179/g.80534 Transcript_35179/m.80534 type:complete len:142 (-) Transcript_35179:130-555(-)|eukprot:2788479-Amphidinium_carterae.1
MARRAARSLLILALVAVAAQVITPCLPFAGMSKAPVARDVSVARAARVDPRGQDSYELWVQHASSAQNYRVLVNKSDKMSDVKAKAIEKLGFEFDFLNKGDFSLSPDGKGSEDSFDESKSVKDCDLIRDDVVQLWFNGVIA